MLKFTKSTLQGLDEKTMGYLSRSITCSKTI